MKFNASKTFHRFKIGLLAILRCLYHTAHILQCIYFCNISVTCVIINKFCLFAQIDIPLKPLDTIVLGNVRGVSVEPQLTNHECRKTPVAVLPIYWKLHSDRLEVQDNIQVFLELQDNISSRTERGCLSAVYRPYIHAWNRLFLKPIKQVIF